MPDRFSGRAARTEAPKGDALVHRLERHPILVLSMGTILLVGILIGIPVVFLKSGMHKAPLRSDLLEVSGHVRSLEPSLFVGKGSAPDLHLRIEEDVRTFRIDGDGRAVLRSTAELAPGTEVGFLISRSESDRSLAPTGMLDALLEWRRIPTVYELRAGRDVLLRLEDYDEHVEASQWRALRLGVLGCVLVLGAVLIVRKST